MYNSTRKNNSNHVQMMVMLLVLCLSMWVIVDTVTKPSEQTGKNSIINN